MPIAYAINTATKMYSAYFMSHMQSKLISSIRYGYTSEDSAENTLPVNTMPIHIAFRPFLQHRHPALHTFLVVRN